MSDFLDIGEAVLVRRHAYYRLTGYLTDVEIELLARRLRLHPEKGRIVEGTALRELKFPLPNSGDRLYVTYFGSEAFREIFVVSFGMTPLNLTNTGSDARRIQVSLSRIIELAVSALYGMYRS